MADLDGGSRENQGGGARGGGNGGWAKVAALADAENCAGLVRYIAACGRRYEPENAFWRDLLNSIPETEMDVDQLPHPTRFVEMTGIDRGKVGNFTRWIRARPSEPT